MSPERQWPSRRIRVSVLAAVATLAVTTTAVVALSGDGHRPAPGAERPPSAGPQPAGSSASAATPLASASGAATSASTDTTAPPTPTVVVAGAGMPGVPTGLRVTGRSTSALELAWIGVHGVSKYRVYRDGVPAATVTRTAWSDTGRAASHTYTYAVSALDAAGKESPRSPAISASTLGAGASGPPAPTGVRTAPVDMTTIRITWRAVSGAVYYLVYRDGEQTGTPAGPLYLDTALHAGRSYNYVVVAVDATGAMSGPSAEVSGQTVADTAAPTPPTGLTVAAITKTSVRLSWNPSTDNDELWGYHIYRDGVDVGYQQNGPGWTDQAVGPGHTYAYRVVAVDWAGNASAASNSVTASTPAPTVTAIKLFAESLSSGCDTRILANVTVDAAPTTVTLNYTINGVRGSTSVNFRAAVPTGVTLTEVRTQTGDGAASAEANGKTTSITWTMPPGCASG